MNKLRLLATCFISCCISMSPMPSAIAAENQTNAQSAGEQIIAYIGDTPLSVNQLIVFIMNNNGQRLKPENILSFKPDQLKSVIKTLLTSQRLLTQAYTDAVLQQRLARGDLRQQVVRFEQNLLRDSYLNKIVQANITEEVIEDFYNQQRDSLEGQQEYRIAHIMTRDAVMAQQALRALRSGVDFALVAKRYSVEPNIAEKGGDLGYLPATLIQKEVLPVISELKINTVSDVIKSSQGFHLFKVLDKRSVKINSLQQARQNITKQLVNKGKQVFLNRLVADDEIVLTAQRTND